MGLKLPFFSKQTAPDDLRGVSVEEMLERLNDSGLLQSKAGAAVTSTTALQVTAVLACVRVIAEGIAQLPLKLYRDKEGGGKSIATDHPVHRLIWKRPNEWMTSFEFREALTSHAVLTGNGFALKNMTNDGVVGELLPLMPKFVTINQSNNYDITYTVRIDGQTMGTFSRDRMLHIKGPTWNFVSGISAISHAREAIGLALAAEESQSRFHSNGGRVGGILSSETKLSPEQLEQIAKAWKAAHGGVQNAHKVAVLDGNLKFSEMMTNAVDSQMIETRKHQIEEIARSFRVFPQMIGHTDKTATYASAEQFFLAHVTHTLNPWICRWEQALDRDLLDAPDAVDLFAEFSVEGLLRGASKDRADFYQKMVNMGAFTRNEVRKLENLDPIDGLDEPLTPMNMSTDDDNKDANDVDQE